MDCHCERNARDLSSRFSFSAGLRKAHEALRDDADSSARSLRAHFWRRLCRAGGICLNALMQAQDDPRFLKGIQEFNDGLFFECHETLEEIWLEDHGDDRKFYQGIIQIAAGYYKLEQGVPAGALKLWRMGVEKLVPYSPAHLGISVDALIQAVEENLSALAAKETSEGNPAIQPPSIHFIC